MAPEASNNSPTVHAVSNRNSVPPHLVERERARVRGRGRKGEKERGRERGRRRKGEKERGREGSESGREEVRTSSYIIFTGVAF